MKITRCFAPPSAWTFTIKPVKEFLKQYVQDGKNWVDPFAGKNSPAEFTNDLNPEMPTNYHLDSFDFVKMLPGGYEGILLDPPYSYRQVTEHYAKHGIKATALDTSSNFLARIKEEMYNKINLNGLAICFGWNTNGFGKRRGFKIIEILIIAHGSHHNDTLVTVERKKWHQNKLDFEQANQ